MLRRSPMSAQDRPKAQILPEPPAWAFEWACENGYANPREKRHTGLWREPYPIGNGSGMEKVPYRAEYIVVDSPGVRFCLPTVAVINRYCSGFRMIHKAKNRIIGRMAQGITFDAALDEVIASGILSVEPPPDVWEPLIIGAETLYYGQEAAAQERLVLAAMRLIGRQGLEDLGFEPRLYAEANTVIRSPRPDLQSLPHRNGVPADTLEGWLRYKAGGLRKNFVPQVLGERGQSLRWVISRDAQEVDDVIKTLQEDFGSKWADRDALSADIIRRIIIELVGRGYPRWWQYTQVSESVMDPSNTLLMDPTSAYFGAKVMAHVCREYQRKCFEDNAWEEFAVISYDGEKPVSLIAGSVRPGCIPWGALSIESPRTAFLAFVTRSGDPKYSRHGLTPVGAIRFCEEAFWNLGCDVVSTDINFVHEVDAYKYDLGAIVVPRLGLAYTGSKVVRVLQ